MSLPTRRPWYIRVWSEAPLRWWGIPTWGAVPGELRRHPRKLVIAAFCITLWVLTILGNFVFRGP